jgi:3-isopropylmalate/(R)-2-methylmalate dehydratase small subunit
MADKIKGKVWKYGDGVNTDVIYPGKYTYKNLTPEEIASHALEDLDPDFSKKAQKGDIIVAGKNFGMGSSREQAVTALKYKGVAAIIAKSFSRIYFRNAINQGIPAIQSEQASDSIKNGEIIEIDFKNGIIITEKGEFSFPSFPDKMVEILEAGGLVEYTKKRLGKN